MPHLTLLIAYTSVATFVNLVDMVWTQRVIKETADNFFFILALVTDGITIVYLLVGIIFIVWVVYGIPVTDKNTFITGFYILVLLLFIAEAVVVFGLEDIIWRNPGEFIDLTWLFELVILGYKALKWVIILSFTLALAELAETIVTSVEAPKAYEAVPQQIVEQQMQPIQFISAEQAQKMWAMPVPASQFQAPIYMA